MNVNKLFELKHLKICYSLCTKKKSKNLRQRRFQQRQILLMEVILSARIDKTPLVPDTNEPNIMKPSKKYTKERNKMCVVLKNKILNKINWKNAYNFIQSAEAKPKNAHTASLSLQFLCRIFYIIMSLRSFEYPHTHIYIYALRVSVRVYFLPFSQSIHHSSGTVKAENFVYWPIYVFIKNQLFK